MTQFFVSRGADLATAQRQAFTAIDRVVRREAYIQAFNDCFYCIGFALLLSRIAVIFPEKSKH